MVVIQSCAVLQNISRLEKDPQPPDEIDNITQLLGEEITKIEAATQPQNNNTSSTICSYTKSFFYSINM